MYTHRRLHARLLGHQLVESDKHGKGSVARGCGGGTSRCWGPQGMVPSGRGLHTRGRHTDRGWFVTAETWQTTRGLRATPPSPQAPSERQCVCAMQCLRRQRASVPPVQPCAWWWSQVCPRGRRAPRARPAIAKKGHTHARTHNAEHTLQLEGTTWKCSGPGSGAFEFLGDGGRSLAC